MASRITFENLLSYSKNNIPVAFYDDFLLVKEAVKSGLHKKDKEVYNISLEFLNMLNFELQPKLKPKAEPKPKTVKGTFDFEVNKINIDENRFQNRNKLNESVLQQIVENYNSEKLDPVVIWKDAKGKVFLLAGHHRLEATKRLNLKSIPARFFTGSEAEAIKYAKVESNSNRSLETPLERAKIYREMRKSKLPKEVEAEAKKFEGKNASYILNLSFLKPNGIVEQTLLSLESSDTQNKQIIEKIADWIGNVRRFNNELTDAHEKEMFDFLNDESSSKRFKTKVDFIQKIYAIVSEIDFDSSQPLNLKRFKYVTEGETQYNLEYSDLKKKLEEALEKKAELNKKATELVSSGKNQEEINEQLNAYEKAISKVKEEISFFQKKIIELQKNKANYTNAGANQVALFGVKKVTPKPAPKKHAKISKIALAGNDQDSQFFNVAGEVGKFLQQVEKKPVESVVITMDGQQGAGKTTTLYKFMDSFAVTGNSCLFLSLEEHPASSLAKDKVSKYLSTKAQENIDTVGEVESITELYEFVKDYEIIFIDSWQKLQRMVGAIRLDEDLRKKFNGKVFVVIFQQTTTGRTKGGAEVVFDGDIIIKMVKESSFSDNYAYFDKNRYTLITIEDIRYNIATGTTYNPNKTVNETVNTFEEIGDQNQELQEVEFSFIVK